MPLQNRVSPFGVIEAITARGTFMGNRGGRIHDPRTRTLLSRRWANRRWIICRLCFANRHRDVMGEGYTELFFLDEVTALAAGHRPCFECRRGPAEAFFAAHNAAAGGSAPRLTAKQLDCLLHEERTSRQRPAIDPANAPDGTVFDIDGTAYAKRAGKLLAWSHTGYGCSVSTAGMPASTPLTPSLTIGILARGYRPVWHESAG